MRITEIWRFPVKSMGGERLDRARVDADGITGDRGWGVFDPATGLVLTARREPRLLLATARLVGGGPVITLEDGRELSSDDALSAWLGHRVELRAASTGPATFENPMDVEHETEWIRWESSGGTYHDGRSKISLVSAASLADFDLRRFRINLILDGEGETELTGEVAVGSAALTIRHPIDRCVMVNRAQPGVPEDRSVLGRIIRERDNRMGVGATVAVAGEIAVGDEIPGPA